MVHHRLLSLATLCVAAFSVQAYDVTLVAEDLEVPWSIEFVDKNTALVSEKNGHIVELDLTTGRHTNLYQPDNVYDRGQGGLLDLAFHPQDKTRLYLTYSQKSKNGAKTVLAGMRYQSKQINDFKDLLVTESETDSGRHFGSRIAFDEQNYLYFSVGDRGERDNGQDRTTHAGSLMRLNADGTLPDDNPFTDNQTERAIWSYGHRNAQGLFFDKPSQSLWLIEHGPRGGDEINLIKKGANYGWPVTSHGKEYWGPLKVGEAEHKAGIESPRLVYIPSIAPSGLLLYRGENYPEFNGKLLTGALKLTHINLVAIKGNSLSEEGRLFEGLNERIRDIQVSPDDYIYFTTDSGKVYRIEPGL